MYGFLNDLYQATLKHLPNVKFDKGSEAHRTLISLYATIIELTNSAILIREAGGYTGMDILLRTAMEAHVDLINLASDEAYLKSMLAVYHKEWIKLTTEGVKGENPFLTYFKDNDEVKEQLAYHKRELSALEAIRSIPTNLEKFRMAGMEDVYRSIYNSLCNDSHNNIRALTHRHFRQRDGDTDMIIFDIPSKIDLAATLDTFIAILLTSNEIMHVHFKSEEKVREELDYFRRFREEKGQEWIGDLGA
ncbi:hypothetical protein G6L34_18250 [Agrobacterium tumefaciens]|uniref:DUF5677 domain-containing protein n=1 Tax=Agrobacterium tumefaciens TaxID=358 RepID=UPI00157461B6|nr:DUF5677 domain-containing protein [Agrobacterium tumefaciens]NTA50054.1 hypothetical protein [Agrobacterium tumefaciens]